MFCFSVKNETMATTGDNFLLSIISLIITFSWFSDLRQHATLSAEAQSSLKSVTHLYASFQFWTLSRLLAHFFDFLV